MAARACGSCLHTSQRTRKTERGQEAGLDYKPQSSLHSNPPCSIQEPHLPVVPQPRRVVPRGARVFKHMTLWETLHKPQHLICGRREWHSLWDCG